MSSIEESKTVAESIQKTNENYQTTYLQNYYSFAAKKNWVQSIENFKNIMVEIEKENSIISNDNAPIVPELKQKSLTMQNTFSWSIGESKIENKPSTQSLGTNPQADLINQLEHVFSQKMNNLIKKEREEREAQISKEISKERQERQEREAQFSKERQEMKKEIIALEKKISQKSLLVNKALEKDLIIINDNSLKLGIYCYSIMARKAINQLLKQIANIKNVTVLNDSYTLKGNTVNLGGMTLTETNFRLLIQELTSLKFIANKYAHMEYGSSEINQTKARFSFIEELTILDLFPNCNFYQYFGEKFQLNINASEDQSVSKAIEEEAKKKTPWKN